MDIDSDQESTRLPLHYPRSTSPVRKSTPVHKKRYAGDFVATPGLPPLKRLKGEFNAAYLSLLNQDIQDASLGLIKGREGGEAEGYGDEYPESSPSQIGAVVWSAAETNVFFAAVSRLGRDDVERIAARIGTKSELEVRQYLFFLDAAKRQPGVTAGEGKVGAVTPLPPRLASVEIPAAVEIGAECAFLLEAAADALALCQGGYEEEVEKERWGAGGGITGPGAGILEEGLQRRQGRTGRAEDPKTATEQRRDREEREQRSLTQKGDDDNDNDEEKGGEEWDKSLEEMPFVELLHVENWLRLSDRVFMNSAIADGNWRAMSEEDEPPAIQATALTDFHALALSVTKRLLFAAAYVAESRVRRRVLDGSQRRLCPRLRPEDVKAAVLSLGMRQDSREFWARCARRLQLDVVDDGIEEEDDIDIDNYDDYTQENEGDDDDDDAYNMDIDEQMSTGESSDKNVEDHGQEMQGSEEEHDYEVMTYDEVEAVLGFQASNIRNVMPGGPSSPETDDGDVFPSPEDTSSASSFEDENGDEGTEEAKEAEDDDSLNIESINRDIEEAMTSIVHTEGTTTLPALRSRIRAEHRLERDAERLDAKASADAEARLWAVLRGDSNSKTK